MAERTGARPRTAEWDAGAVLTTVADTASGDELNQVIRQLPSGYAALFGKADLAGRHLPDYGRGLVTEQR